MFAAADSATNRGGQRKVESSWGSILDLNFDILGIPSAHHQLDTASASISSLGSFSDFA